MPGYVAGNGREVLEGFVGPTQGQQQATAVVAATYVTSLAPTKS